MCILEMRREFIKGLFCTRIFLHYVGYHTESVVGTAHRVALTAFADGLIPKALPAYRNRPWRCHDTAVHGLTNYGGSLMEFVWFILVGLVAGWLAGVVMKGGGFGVIGDIIVGILGAVLGGFLFGSLGISAGGGLLGAIIVATIGAIVLIFVLRLIKRA